MKKKNIGEAESEFNELLDMQRFDEIEWDGTDTITFDAPIEFDEERQQDKSFFDEFILSAEAEAKLRNVPLPDLSDIHQYRAQIEETYSNFFLIDDLYEDLERWFDLENEINKEQLSSKDAATIMAHEEYQKLPDIVIHPHEAGEYFDGSHPPSKL